jgi:hypothetical protein
MPVDPKKSLFSDPQLFASGFGYNLPGTSLEILDLDPYTDLQPCTGT